MVPNRLAFAALGIACVTAAGVGGYLGTRHNVAELPGAAAQAPSASVNEPAATAPAATSSAATSAPAPVPDLAPTTEPTRASTGAARTPNASRGSTASAAGRNSTSNGALPPKRGTEIAATQPEPQFPPSDRP